MISKIFVFLALVALASCQAPIIQVPSGNNPPTFPDLPSQFSASFIEFIDAADSDFILTGYIYYDVINQKSQTDATYDGGMSSTFMDYNANKYQVSMYSAGELTCVTGRNRLPMPTPALFENFAFVGHVALKNGFANAWQPTTGDYVYTVYTDIITGTLLGESFSGIYILFEGLSETIPDTAFFENKSCPNQSGGFLSNVPSFVTLTN